MKVKAAIVSVIMAASLPVFANDMLSEDPVDHWEEDAMTFILQNQDPDNVDTLAMDPNETEDLLHLVQSGRVWTCFVRGRNGRVFSGQSRNRSTARRVAFNRCISRANGCILRNCR